MGTSICANELSGSLSSAVNTVHKAKLGDIPAAVNCGADVASKTLVMLKAKSDEPCPLFSFSALCRGAG